MDEAPRRSLAQEAEDVLRRLRGVTAVRVDARGERTIERVHVLASADRSPRAVVTDIIAALAAELGVTLDPAQVRVATVGPGQEAAGPAPLRPRLKFVGLTFSTLRQGAEVRLQLEQDGMLYEGSASGPNTPEHRLELVGEATLRAVETFLRARDVFRLEGVALATLASRQVAVALVAWLGPGGDLLAGSSVVRDDAREAVVRAVLAAVNRHVGWLGGP